MSSVMPSSGMASSDIVIRRRHVVGHVVRRLPRPTGASARLRGRGLFLHLGARLAVISTQQERCDHKADHDAAQDDEQKCAAAWIVVCHVESSLSQTKIRDMNNLSANRDAVETVDALPCFVKAGWTRPCRARLRRSSTGVNATATRKFTITE